jgi:hypothetical protein
MKLQRKTLGYGFKLSAEPLSEALANYGGEYHGSRKEVLAEIERCLKDELIAKNSRPKVFKVVVEIE